MAPPSKVPPLAPLTAKVSLSPANEPPVTATVALNRSRSSGSAIETALDDNVTAPPCSVKDALGGATLLSVGGSLTLMMLMVVVIALVSIPPLAVPAAVIERPDESAGRIGAEIGRILVRKENDSIH